ncbi:glutamyl-tRNA reductase [Actinobacillus succinogenes]|uniref:Glutamyl-tRNA reductase n=1 Tax=Actinobacillus succinogenes (strain ATCC 55618 / DSM 22257 / CCUG 43843 / 130Z) TaxID=339671 RepID=HEM1_ACTSZ|nr:glutamyl-tRNA reductase [Actinobacillus succinogenes]A6VND5.1 RecName: Full=Glutamyl-tRNA reductase; Short=GluTR [Actinobacillus succinogenes 130Z]ABR74482.1 Glutamyl-tRNA reductase [Actinobacillus succinogenes 130Z]PHI41099.1 glutamyl-tRNA reductase [Actinobacillus succinogenes]
MTILVLGINHKTATVALREKVAFSEEKRLSALNQIEQLKLAQSTVILSTCNRTEVYLHNKFIQPEQNSAWIDECVAWFAAIHQIQLTDLQDCLYFYQNQQAVTHLMRVACGLDSLILGEPQILGQVKQAYQLAEEYYQRAHGLGKSAVISSELSRLFQKTFSTAKRVRTETNIGESAVSVAYAACSLGRQIFESLQELTILLVGAGETIELAARHLLRHGVKKLMIANRTRARAEALVAKLESPFIEILSLSELQDGLNQADIVISSTGSPTTLISYEMMKQAQIQRRYRPVLIVDIAVPRDVEESIVKLDSVYHYTVDDLQNIINHNLSEREKASEQAEEIIAEECAAFFEWLKVRQASNLIRTYRESADEIRQELLEKAQFSLSQGESADKILDEFSTKLMNKLLHSPTLVMQTMVKQGDSRGLQNFLSVIKK